VTTIRVAQRKRFTSIDRDTVNDPTLSFRARGVLLWLLDKPDDWKANADQIAKAGREGRDAVRAALKELQDHRYIEYRNWRDETTGVWQSEWIVRERPKRLTSDGEPALVSRSGEPGPLTKTDTETVPSEASRFDSHPVPSRDESAPPPWKLEGITYAEWRERESARA